MIKSLLTISLLSASSIAFAHTVAPADGDVEAGAGYISAGGSVLQTGANDCLHAGSFSDSAAINQCEGLDAEPEAEPVAEAAPEAPAASTAQVVTAELSGISLFNTNSDELNDAGMASIDDLVGQLAGYKGITSITVIGHTDSRGSEAYNQSLSERRAASVASVLQERYSDVNVMSKGMGENSPATSNFTAAGRQANRRVEVEITASKMTFN